MEENYSSIFPERTVIYATFGQRLAAAVLDGLILVVINIVISLVIAGSITSGNNLLANFVNFIIGWLYYAIQESGVKQATIGKKAMNIMVTDMNGGRIGFGAATGRYFAKILSTLILFIGYLMMLWDNKKQCLHDKLANTLVVSS